MYILFSGFYGSAEGQLYRAATDFHCPFLSKRSSKFLVCCVVNHTGKLDLFLVAPRHKVLTHLWQGKLIRGGDLSSWLLVQTFLQGYLVLGEFKKWKTYILLQSLFQENKLSSIKKA